MSLKAFHLFFVTLSIALGAWVTSWCFEVAPKGYAHLMGIVSGTLTAGLAVYLIWVGKKLSRVGMLAIALFVSVLPEVSQACAVCFGNPKSPLVQSANTAILFLMGVIGAVLTGFATLFLGWRQRAIRLQKADPHF